MTSSLYTLGTAQLGMAYGVANRTGKPDGARAFKILDEAVKQGVVSFDTASAYGDSEEILGEYFHRSPGIHPEIITKIKPLTFNSRTRKESGIQEIHESVQRSLERLQIDSIPVLLFHRYEDLIWNNHCLLDYLRGSPCCNEIGVSVYSPEEAAAAMDLDGVSVIQLPTNIVDLRFIEEGIFETAKRKHIRIFIRSVYLQGLILMDVHETPPHLHAANPVLEKLRRICEPSGMTLRECAISFLKSLPPLRRHPVVIGCEHPRQVRENAILMRTTLKLSEAIIQKLFEEMNGAPDYVINPSMWRVES